MTLAAAAVALVLPGLARAPDTTNDFGQADQFQQDTLCGGPFGPNSTYCATILK